MVIFISARFFKQIWRKVVNCDTWKQTNTKLDEQICKETPVSQRINVCVLFHENKLRKIKGTWLSDESADNWLSLLAEIWYGWSICFRTVALRIIYVWYDQPSDCSKAVYLYPLWIKVTTPHISTFTNSKCTADLDVGHLPVCICIKVCGGMVHLLNFGRSFTHLCD